jgi:hypothetical protein
MFFHFVPELKPRPRCALPPFLYSVPLRYTPLKILVGVYNKSYMKFSKILNVVNGNGHLEVKTAKHL